MLGAVLGFTAATVKQVAAQLVENALKIIHSYLFGVTVWPKHGKVTLLAILSVAAFLYAVRLIQFLLRFWRSWWSGLISGIEVIWFVSAGGAFTCLSLTGTYRSLLLSAEFPISHTVPRRSQRDFSCPLSASNQELLLGDGDVNRLVLSANLMSGLGSLQAAVPM
jgi:hypothetical protein